MIDFHVVHISYDWLTAILGALSGLSGLFGNKGTQQQQAQQTNSRTQDLVNTSSHTMNSSMPQYDATTGAFRDKLLDQYNTALNTDPDMSGYQANALEDINRGAGLQDQALQANLAARGITGPAAATASAGVQDQRFARSIALKNTVPLLAQDRRNAILQQAGGFFSSLPVGQQGETYSAGTTQGDSQSQSFGNSTTTQSGQPAGGFLTGLTQWLARLYGNKAGLNSQPGGGYSTNDAGQNNNTI